MSDTSSQVKASFCALCKSRCGATYTVVNGKLVSAGPFPEHPTGKALCMKGKAAPEILYSEDRVLYPMRRTNPKTDPEPVWERITWGEAMSEIADKLNAVKTAHGAEAIAVGVTTPSGTPFSDAFDWAHRFQYALGTPNNVSGTEVCNWHKDTAHAFTVGSSILYPDYENADTIVLWGFNPSAVWLDQATQVAEARARGATIIAVDPRDAGYARDANHWLRVRPGTDGVLLMGMANLVITQGGYDNDWLTQWSNGPFLVSETTGRFLRSCDLKDGEGDDYVVLSASGDLVCLPTKMDRLSKPPYGLALLGDVKVETGEGKIHCKTAFSHYADVAATYPLDRVAKETGIPAEMIEAAASALINAKSVCYYAWTGIAQNPNASQIDRALAMLMSMTGSYDKPGGNVAFSRHETNSIFGFDLLPMEQRAKALGLDKRPLGPPAEAMITSKDFYTSVLESKPYHIKAMLSFGANHVVSHGETDRAVKAYSSLEFFVHCNTVVTPTAKYADIFLPVNTPWEREGLRVGFDVSQEANELIQLRAAVVPSLGESRSDLEIIFELAQRLGFGDKFFDGDIDKAYAYILEPTGVTLDELRAAPEGIRKPLSYQPKKYASANGDGFKGFATDTGRVEIYSELLQRHGYSPIPAFTPSRRDAAKYPFVLTTAKTGYYTHTQFRNIPSLRKRFPEPVVQVCSDTAEDLGLVAGDMVWIENRHGRIKMKLKIDKSLHPEVVSASYGWWQGNTNLGLPGYDALSEEGANYNRLIVPDDIDPISGTVPHRLSECRLVAVNSAKQVKPAWAGFRPASVTTLVKVAEGVTRVGFSVDRMGRLPDYLPGQHITLRVMLPGSDQQITRCYSLVGSATDPDRSEYFISVRHVLPPLNAPVAPDGLMSSFINQKLELGAHVELKAPGGRFIIPPASDTPIVVVAGGIGITPFLSQLETVAATGSAPRVHLVYANRNSAVHAYSDRIADLKAAISSLTVTDIYNEPLESDLAGETFDKAGFATVDDILLPEFDVVPNVFMCGPPPMMAALESALAERGHPADHLHQEAFVSPVATKPIPTGPFTVHFAKSGVTAEWTNKSGSLLELGESLGLNLESGCRVGQCESCAVNVDDGRYQHLIDVAAEDQKRCLICQAVPTGNITLGA